MASNVNNGSSVPPSGPIIGPQRPANLGVNTTVVADATKKRKQAGFEKGEVKRPKQGNGPRTQAEKEMHDFERFRRTLALLYNSPNGSDYPAKSHPLGVLNGRSAAVLVLRARDAPVLPSPTESWARSVRVKLDMFSQAPCLRVILDSEHSFVIRPANIIKGNRPVWTQNHDYKLDLSEDKIEGTKADLAGLFANHYHCPIQGAIDEIIKISRSGSVVKALSILGFDLGGEFTWETRTADIKDPRYDQMEAFMTQLNQGVMHAAVVRSQFDEKVRFSKLVDSHWINLMENCRTNGAYSWYRGSIGTELGQLFEAWQAHPDAEVRRQPWMMLKGMDEELRAYGSHDSRKAFGSLREMEIALSLCIIHENMWENYSISKYFNNDTKHGCRADRSRGYVKLHVGVDKDENFVMPSVPAGTRMKFWVVPLEVDEDAEEPAPPAEDEWIKVRGKKVRKPVMPPTGWIPEDQVTEAQVIEVATELDFVLGFRCKDENSRNAFQRGNRMEIWILMERNPIPCNRMLKAIGRMCSPPKTAIYENQQSFLMGHGPLREGDAIHTVCKDKMSNDQKNAFDYLTKSMEMNRQQLQAWSLTFYEACYACFIQGPPGTGKTNIVGGQGIGLALCGVKTLITAPSNIAAREIMNKQISKMDKVAEVFPQVRDWFEIVYLPTRGTTIFDLKETNIDWDNATLGMIQEGENQTGNSNVDDYALWKHIVRTMRDDRDNGSNEAKKTRVRGWLDALAKFKSGQNVANADKKRFAKTSERVATEILSSCDSKVKIVVCTCNTADILHEYGYKPEVCIGDEAAFGFEADFWIPLSLGGCSKIINVGDHIQLQPVVKSHGYSEYSKQLGLSIFARFFNHYSVRTAKFRMNYCIVKEIADFPGIVSYEYLGSHPCTEIENDIEKIDFDKITILTLYKEELADMTKQITLALRTAYPALKRFPRFQTIDSTQGGQNELVLLGITPADQYNGAIIGFLSAWNRMNVGLTCAQSSLVMFGNLDVWRSQLPVLVKRCKNFGFMVIDLLDRGDIIDVNGTNSLPKDRRELMAGPQSYTIEIETPRESDSQLTIPEKALMIDYAKEEYEKRLLKEWHVKRSKAIDYQSKDESGIEFDLPAFGVEEDNKAEKDAMDDLTNIMETSKVSDQVGDTTDDVEMDEVTRQDLQAATANSLVTKEAEVKKNGVDVMDEDDDSEIDWRDTEPVADPNLIEKITDMLGKSPVAPPTSNPQAIEASVPPPPPAGPQVIPTTAPLPPRPTGPQPYQTTPPLFNTPAGTQRITGREAYIPPRAGSGFQPPPPAFNNGQQSPFGPGGHGGIFNNGPPNRGNFNNGPPNRGNFNNGPPAPGGFNDSQRGNFRGGGRGNRGNRSGSGGFGPGNSDRGGSNRGWRNDSWRRN
ncbi:hypothetical protein BCON_0114g00290 [Botryotinia convoluta]|uniref:DNA2/NAM7 helicase helicase domain-containing protein n=1 Tax=Botryotinia convoluta TaxID=54673 RepID=A0A4Z1IBF3_9HELO|nr:hypothetical protein BCON_0114g00290 [Botryotinia convoluta]